MGGRDNITVVLFRLGGDEQEAGARGGGDDGGRCRRSRRIPIRMRFEAAAAPPPPEPPPDAVRRPPEARASARPPSSGSWRCWSCSAVLGGLAVGAVVGLRQVYFVGPGRSRARDALPGRSLRPAARDRSLRPRVRQLDARPRAVARSSAGACWITSCARATTRPTSCAGSRGATSDRAQPRADGADPGLAARHGRVHRGVRRAPDARSATRASPTARSSSGCASRSTCSSARRCRTPTRTCSRCARCWPRSAWWSSTGSTTRSRASRPGGSWRASSCSR